MTNAKKLSRQELVAQLQTKGWDVVTGSRAVPTKDHTLEQHVRAAHLLHTKGEAPGIISRVEDAIEVDAVQLQELWDHLGLPV